jgi:streptogramin lyase
MMRALTAAALLAIAASSALAQGSIPGLTSTPITFSGHADAFEAGPDGNVWFVDQTSNAIGRLAVDGSAYQAFPLLVRAVR